MSDSESIQCGVPTREQELTQAIADEGLKQSIPRLNDAIGKMLTLATAMAGGSLAFLKDDICPPWGRMAAGFFFILSTAAAAFASIPYSSQSSPALEDLDAQFKSACAWKRNCLRVCYGLLLIGFFFAFAGTLAKSLQRKPDCISATQS